MCSTLALLTILNVRAWHVVGVRPLPLAALGVALSPLTSLSEALSHCLVEIGLVNGKFTHYHVCFWITYNIRSLSHLMGHARQLQPS